MHHNTCHSSQGLRALPIEHVTHIHDNTFNTNTSELQTTNQKHGIGKIFF